MRYQTNKGIMSRIFVADFGNKAKHHVNSNLRIKFTPPRKRKYGLRSLSDENLLFPVPHAVGPKALCCLGCIILLLIFDANNNFSRFLSEMKVDAKRENKKY